MSLKMLGFDFGASGGRGMLGEYDGERLAITEVNRFANDPVQIGGRLRWDFLRLYHELLSGIGMTGRAGFRDVASVGVNTWGVDFGLIDEYGDLMQNPFHYRDSLTDDAMEEMRELIADRELYRRTGIQFMKFNTIYQLFMLKLKYPSLFQRAKKMLFLPDLFGYFLTGNATAEYSIASTSAMLDVKRRNWDRGLLEFVGLDTDILPEITMPGTLLGGLSRDVEEETGLTGAKVVSVCGHDTACAVLAAPLAREKPGAYLSCGTWSLLGVEISEPITHDGAFKAQYTNEGGHGGVIRFLKNIMGQWMANELKREYERDHGAISYKEMDGLEREAAPFTAFVDADAPEFAQPGRMAEKIHAFCDRTGQRRPVGLGALMRCVNESIALSYRVNIDALEDILGYSLPELRVVGGGIKNRGLMSMAACALNRPVLAGPVEASAAGNILSQLCAFGEIKDRWEAREITRRSFETREYGPDAAESARWGEAVARYNENVKGK